MTKSYPVGASFRAMRKMRGLTQEELAVKAGIARTSISNIEVDRQNPSLAKLEEIANAMGYRIHLTFKLIPKE